MFSAESFGISVPMFSMIFHKSAAKLLCFLVFDQDKDNLIYFLLPKVDFVRFNTIKT